MRIESYLQTYLQTSAPRAIFSLADKFCESSYQLFLVGGSLRDIALLRQPSDFDFATDATPDEMKEILKDYKLITIGEKYGTIGVCIDNILCEITTFRSEKNYSDNRHPSEVSFARELDSDIKRRDFTINALAFDLIKLEMRDICGGMRDIRSKIVRAIGNPHERFAEDSLRILRAFSLCARFDFALDSETLEAIIANKEKLGQISSERIKNEMNKIIRAKHAKSALFAIKKHEILDIHISKNLFKTSSKNRAIFMCLNEKNHAFFYSRDIKKARILCEIQTILKTAPKNAKKLKIFLNLMAKNYGLDELEIALNTRLKKYFNKKKIKKLMKLKINGYDIAKFAQNQSDIGRIERELGEKVLKHELKNERNALLKKLRQTKI